MDAMGAGRPGVELLRQVRSSRGRHAARSRRARVGVHQTLRAFLKVAKWEARQGSRRGHAPSSSARWMSSPMRTRQRHFCRVRAVRGALRRGRARARHLPLRSGPSAREAAGLKADLVRFEKQHGDQQGIEAVILDKRREEYRKQLEQARRTTTRGSLPGGWRRALATKLVFVRRTSRQLQRPSCRASVIGGGASTYGSITPCTRSLSRKTWIAREPCGVHAWVSCRTSSSLLPRCG